MKKFMAFINVLILTGIVICMYSCSQPSNYQVPEQDYLVSLTAIPDAELYIGGTIPYILDSDGEVVLVSYTDNHGNITTNVGCWDFIQISMDEFYMDTLYYGVYILNIINGSLTKIDSEIDESPQTAYPIIKRNNELYWTDGSNVFKRNITTNSEIIVAAQSDDFGSNPAFYLTKNNHVVTQGKLFPSNGEIPVATGIPDYHMYFYGPDDTLYVHYVRFNTYVLKSIEYANDVLEITTIRNQNPGFSSDPIDLSRVNSPFSTKQTLEEPSQAKGYVAVNFSGNTPVISYITYPVAIDFDITNYFYHWNIASGSQVLRVREANTSDSFVSTIDTSSVIQYDVFGPLVIYEKYESGSIKKWYYQSVFSNTQKELPASFGW